MWLSDEQEAAKHNAPKPKKPMCYPTLHAALMCTSSLTKSFWIGSENE